MRRISLRRQRLLRTVAGFRADFKERIGRCEFCGAPCDPVYLTIHEIARGHNRAKALNKPYALLCLHWITVKDSGGLQCCHDQVQREPEARQLARLKLSRPDEFDLSKYNSLVNERAPNRITQSEVDAEIKRLLTLTQPRTP